MTDVELLSKVSVRSVSIRFTVKRTRKNVETDEFESVEASEGWTFKPDQTLPLAEVKLLANHFTPIVAGRALFALNTAGALTGREFTDILNRFRKAYESRTGGSDLRR